MKNAYRILSLSLTAILALALHTAAYSQEALQEFGPYVALSRDANIVKDVKVEENGRIYLLLNPEFREEEIILKNSSGLKDGYRKWSNGELELVSPANQGKAAGEYTDWVTTSGNYIEYYMEGKLILHLAKKSVVQN